MNFTIIGTPFTKKNSQRIIRNKRTGRPLVIQSKQSRVWENTAILQLQSAWRGRPPLTGPVSMAARVYRARAVGDIGNFLAAICDAIERAGVVVNDKQIVNFDGSRLDVDRVNPRVEVVLTEQDGRRDG